MYTFTARFKAENMFKPTSLFSTVKYYIDLKIRAYFLKYVFEFCTWIKKIYILCETKKTVTIKQNILYLSHYLTLVSQQNILHKAVLVKARKMSLGRVVYIVYSNRTGSLPVVPVSVWYFPLLSSANPSGVVLECPEVGMHLCYHKSTL